jgi:hypothetical protein
VQKFIRTGIDDVLWLMCKQGRGAGSSRYLGGRFGETIQENAAGAKATLPF